MKGDCDQDLSFDLDQTFANFFASILCTFQYCLLCSKTCHSHKSNFSMFDHHEFFFFNESLNMSNLYLGEDPVIAVCEIVICDVTDTEIIIVTGETAWSGIEFKIFKEMVCVITYLYRCLLNNSCIYPIFVFDTVYHTT